MKTDKRKFNLLSIGQRGVGKTVFLAGSYAELQTATKTSDPQRLRFDCQDVQEQKNIEKILNYVAQTAHYPPPTMKVTTFNFSLKRHSLLGDQTLCHFRWWEIPGEICQTSNQEFHKLVSSSHGCCVFIDALELLENQTYLQGIEDIVETVMGIASLVYLNDLKYAFALVLTKCDQLKPGSFDKQRIAEQLQPLTSYLNETENNYHLFYSHIPIVGVKGSATLSAVGAASALVWLVSELGKAHKSSWLNTLLDSVIYLKPTYLQQTQEQQALENGSLETLFKPLNSHGKKALLIKKTLTVWNRLLLLLIGMGFLAGNIVLLAFVHFGQRESGNLDTLREVTTLEQRGQFDRAVSLMEKLIQQEPDDLELRLQLAQLYQFTGQVTKAETTYDQVLAMQKNNLDALIGKARIREIQGDVRTAKVLFSQAENMAPKQMKAKVHAIAAMTLRSLANPSTKP